MEPANKHNRRWAIIIGVGLALSPVHNQWLTDLVTSDGEVGFFLPVFGWFIILLASGWFLTYNHKLIDFGSKAVYIPLLIIVVAIGVSGIKGNWPDVFMGMFLFVVYLAARILGKDIFLPLAIGAGIASLGIIAYGILHPGIRTGGFVFERNYDIATGYILLGVALFPHKYQWLLAGLALVALFMSGSPEAIFAIGIIALVVIIRRDWTKKLIYASCAGVVIAIVYFALGHGQELYAYTASIIFDHEQVAIPLRLEVISIAMAGISPLGEGYNLTAFTPLTVHNVPLIIVQQLGYAGILAGIAWLWVSIWCLIKTRMKYVWVLILALSVFDHFIWTQLAPLWWAVVGVSTSLANREV